MTITKTFPLTLNTSTSASTVIEVAHFRDILIESGDSVAIYLEAMFCNISLKSFQLMRFPDYDGDENDAERLSKFTESELKSQKIGLRILTRKNNAGNWRERAEVILTNAGRKSYFDLLIPYLAKAQVKLLEYNDSLGVQLIDYGNGLLKENDFIEIECACSVQIEKKNDVEALSARIEALETLLSTFGAPSASLPGTNGLVPAPPANGGNRLLKGDRTWQDPSEFILASSAGIHGNATIPNTPKGGWTGLYFEGPPNRNYLLQNPITGEIGFYDAIVPKWNLRITSEVVEIGKPIQINNSAIIKKVLSVSTIISLPSIVVNGLSQVNITLTGAVIGGFVSVSPVINNILNGYWTFYCHAQVLTPNTVTLSFKNDWIGELDLADFWVRILYIEF